ncbi:MAG: hypothetical protein JW388_0744 [Nitrospira sp.]|nr:hypothetical protein [Nitrospira sp.]
MALRGPQQAPDSRRGLVANRGAATEIIQDEITAPKMDAARRKIFLRLVAENRAAGVAIRQIDADFYSDLADCMIRSAEATDELYLRWVKHINDLRSALNMGPRNRQRAGIRDTQPAKAVNAQLALIDRAKRNSIL